MTVFSLADVTCDGSPHAISATTQNAKWVQVTAVSVASASVPIRVGGANTAAGIGAPLFAPGSSQFLPAISELTTFYNLAQILVQGAVGDKFSVLYAV